METVKRKTYYEKNRRRMLENSKAYYWKNKEKVNAYFKQYYHDNKYKIRQKQKINAYKSRVRAKTKYRPDFIERKPYKKFIDYTDVPIIAEDKGMNLYN